MQSAKRELDQHKSGAPAKHKVKVMTTRLGATLGLAVLLAGVWLPALRVYALPEATSIAGTGTDGPLVNEIQATDAQFWNPADVIATSDGTIYVADKNHNQIRSITADGVIHNAFGDAMGTAGCGTGSTQTRLYNPDSLAKDQHDNIYLATGCGEIVKFTPGNLVGTVIAGKFDGTGNPNPITHDGMVATDVTMLPSRLSYDMTTDALYFYEGATSRIVELSGGMVSFVAGTGVSGFSGDGGLATAAQLSSVSGILVVNGSLYISDGCRIRMVDTAGYISTIAGDGTCQDANDNGPATTASIQYPGPLAMDASGVLYIGGALSGSIFSYDPDTKNLAFVIGLIANNTGLAFDDTGNLLALHSGVNQRLYKITGLLSTTPQQHGIVTNVTWKVSPTTVLWNMDMTVTTGDVSCPATVVVKVGTWPKRVTVCGTGETAPAATNFRWKVFSLNRSFDPGSNQKVTAFIAKSDAPHYGGPATMLSVPSRPMIIGVGDSYISGHHQEPALPGCRRADNAQPQDTTCNLFSNDPSFSWITLTANKLNATIPTQWQYDVHDLAQSGATTRQMFEQGQVVDMETLLTNNDGSWNVVAFDGGANNVNFGSILRDFYLAHPVSSTTGNLYPWEAKKLSDCPNTELLYDRLFGVLGTAPADAQRPVIKNDLEGILAAGRGGSSSTRFLDMLYPYTTNTNNITNVCINGKPDGTWHGSKSIVEYLNDIHRDLSGADLLTLDLQDKLGANPVSKLLQQTIYYGYPHPNADGQEKIAQQAAKLLRQQ